MISFTTSTLYDQKKPVFDFNEKELDKNKAEENTTKENSSEENSSDEQCHMEICIHHSHPKKLEDFFTKKEKSQHIFSTGEKVVWITDQSSLDKVNGLIKDIEFFHSHAVYPIELVMLKDRKKMSNEEKKASNDFVETYKSKCINTVKKDLSLLYSIYAYTQAASNDPVCLHRPLVKTISELAFTTINSYKESRNDEISDKASNIIQGSTQHQQLESLLQTLGQFTRAQLNEQEKTSRNSTSDSTLKKEKKVKEKS